MHKIKYNNIQSIICNILGNVIQNKIKIIIECIYRCNNTNININV